MKEHKIYKMSVASVYPHYFNKIQRKGRTEDELLQIIEWLTGYNDSQLNEALASKLDFETFFNNAPKLNAKRQLITGIICGVRVEEITEPLMREIRYLDKLVDELAKGRPMDKILRKMI